MKKRRKCKYCGSEFVCWNWFKSPFWKTYFVNFFYNNKFPFFRWKFWTFFDRWGAECWNCSGVQGTFFKVKDISYEDLKKEFVHLPKHEIRDAIENFWWMIGQGKHFRNHEKVKYDRRMNNTFEIIKDALEEQWKIDHPDWNENTPQKTYGERNVLPDSTYEAILGDEYGKNT